MPRALCPGLPLPILRCSALEQQEESFPLPGTKPHDSGAAIESPQVAIGLVADHLQNVSTRHKPACIDVFGRNAPAPVGNGSIVVLHFSVSIVENPTAHGAAPTDSLSPFLPIGAMLVLPTPSVLVEEDSIPNRDSRNRIAIPTLQEDVSGFIVGIACA